MAREHKVYLLTSQPLQDFAEEREPEFPADVQIISSHSVARYKSVFNRVLPQRLADAINYRYMRKTFLEPTNAYFLEVYPALLSLLKTVNFDIIYYENLEALDLLGQVINKKNPAAVKLYDAHNVDSELWTQQAVSENKAAYKIYAENALKIERTLYKRVNAFMCCSESDSEKLLTLNKHRIKGITIPNGVAVETRPFDENEEKYLIKNILFCGSLGYYPNKEGLLWFYKNVFPLLKKKIPTVTLTVIGNMPDSNDFKFLLEDERVNLIGTVESVVPYYQQSSMAIVPLLSGSGTRLKILEAMSMGNPIVSTKVGAEGLNYVAGEHLLIADQPEAFAENLLRLLSDKKCFNSIRCKAYEYVSLYYDWQNIGKSINNFIDKIIDNHDNKKIG